MNGISTSVYLTKESIEKIDNVKGTKKMSTVINTLFANMSEDHLKSLIGKMQVDGELEIKYTSIEECKYSKDDIQSVIKALNDIQETSDSMQSVLEGMQSVLEGMQKILQE